MTQQIIQPGDGDPRHGTEGGYSNNWCRGPCCRAVATRAALARRASRTALLAAGTVTREHGTYDTYNNWGCRCPLCREANRVRRAAQLSRRRP